MNTEQTNTIAKLKSGNESLHAALRQEHERAKKLETKNATLHVALSNLLNTSAVVKSGEDFTEISCTNTAYNAAYEALKSDDEDGPAEAAMLSALDEMGESEWKRRYGEGGK